MIVERNQFQRIPVALQGLAGTRFEGIFPDMRENGVVKYIKGRVIREIGRKGFVVHDLVVRDIWARNYRASGFSNVGNAILDFLFDEVEKTVSFEFL